ncbi:hypothetical protein TB1_033402 [Malus domestica]
MRSKPKVSKNLVKEGMKGEPNSRLKQLIKKGYQPQGNRLGFPFDVGTQIMMSAEIRYCFFSSSSHEGVMTLEGVKVYIVDPKRVVIVLHLMIDVRRI